MEILNNEEMIKVKGGGAGRLIFGLIGGALAFLFGVIDGIISPKKCK